MPTVNSIAYNHLTSFWDKSKFIQNDAQQYPPHATLVSFFETLDPIKLFETVKNISKKYDFKIKPLSIVSKQNIKYISIFSHQLDLFIQEITLTLNLLSSSIGSIHITLTHNTCPKYDKILTDLIKQNIDINVWSESEWNIVMLERSSDKNFKYLYCI